MDGELVPAVEMTGEVVPIVEIDDGSDAEKSSRGTGIRKFLGRIVREIIAVLFWLYVVVKLFAFDIDVYLMKRLQPDYVWLLNLKFFILIGILALVWLVTKSKSVLAWTSYVVFYPVIIVFWRIPFFVFKQKSWILAFAFINAMTSFVRSLKYSFIASAFFLISVVVIFRSSTDALLWISTVIIFVILLMAYIHRLVAIFKPSEIFKIHIKVISEIRKRGRFLFQIDEGIKNLPIEHLDQSQMDKWTASLQMSVLFNRVCLITSKKLGEYQKSKFNAISYVMAILLLLILTVFSFATINYGLFKVDASFFSFSQVPNYFTFIHYSFKSSFFNSIPEITPITPVVQTVSMIEFFLAFSLIGIFVSMLKSVRSEKYSEELSGFIAGVEGQGDQMEKFIKDEYKIDTINEAIAELDKLKSGLAKLFYSMSEGID